MSYLKLNLWHIYAIFGCAFKEVSNRIKDEDVQTTRRCFPRIINAKGMLAIAKINNLARYVTT